MDTEFIVGNTYTYNFLEQVCINENFTADENMEYGEELLGQHAIWFNENGVDYWFILNSATAKDYYYKCVYIG